ncbi:MAG TPA: hypothetical protein VN709_04350 [Terriglobales bacterium]|nr:hypothetical protein [Terriglobales bacterium]
MDEAGVYERMDWISLDNFLTTHPALKKITRWYLEHSDQLLNADEFSAAYGQPTSWLDLKGLVIHKVLTPINPAGEMITLPFVIDASTRFRFNLKLKQLAEDVLAKNKPGPRPDTEYPEQEEKGNTGGRTWQGWKILPPG